MAGYLDCHPREYRWPTYAGMGGEGQIIGCSAGTKLLDGVCLCVKLCMQT
jgi:hypothetical protein